VVLRTKPVNTAASPHACKRIEDRILKVARTIADLVSADRIESPRLLEAIPYRSLNRNVFY
jgi:magnesium chelatase family protein